MLNLSTYREVVANIETYMHQKECLKVLKQKFCQIPHTTLLSIYSQHYQHYTKQVHGSHRRSEMMEEYYQKYLDARTQENGSREELIFQMANTVRLSPVLFARIVLEEFINDNKLAPSDSNVRRDLVSQWIKSPSDIPDLCLRKQVRCCILNDTNYGPLAENIKHSVGHEYEFLLQEKLEELNIVYLDEKALRSRGYDKTPDFKLEVPVAIGGHVVNWIESKASFGDENNHKKYLGEQFWSYQNRFGPGLVIYWFGYIEELDVHQDQGILLMDRFPPVASLTTLQCHVVSHPGQDSQKL